MRVFDLQGHRGARGLAPENTLDGCRRALAVGVSRIEIDVALSADGVVMLSHDPVLDPDLTRGPDGRWIDPPGARLRDLTRAELAGFDVGRARPGSAVAAAHPDQVPCDGEGLPTLDEVFEATAKADSVIIDVELKTDPRHPDLTATPAELAEAVVASATRMGAMARLAIRSFDWRGLAHVRANWPQIPLGFLTEPATCVPEWSEGFAIAGRPVPDTVFAAAGAGALWAPDHASLDVEMIDRAHDLGMKVAPWTVNLASDMDRFIRWGVDGFCTDRPDIARKVMADHRLTLPRSISLV
jgi:glycerophosphoryl diester phosphodiesterase